MPVKKSAFKALRQTAKRTLRNKKHTSDITAVVRKVRKSISANDQKSASELLASAVKKIDKATQKGALKKNTAARKKSRLAKAVNAITKK